MTIGMIYPGGHAEAGGTCRRCGRRMERLEATINDIAYCHPDEGPDCYRIVCLQVAAEQYSIPQQIWIGDPL